MHDVNEEKKIYYRSKIGQFAKLIYYIDEEEKETSSFKGKLIAVFDNKLIIENIITLQSGSFDINAIKHDLFEPIKIGDKK